jgi:hypothetical protein
MIRTMRTVFGYQRKFKGLIERVAEGGDGRIAGREHQKAVSKCEWALKGKVRWEGNRNLMTANELGKKER